MIGFADFRARRQAEARRGRPVSRAGLRLLRRGHGDRPVRGRARSRRAERQGPRRHRLDHAGPGARHDVRADRRGRDRLRSGRRHGGHRRYDASSTGAPARTRAAAWSPAATRSIAAAMAVREKALRLAASLLEVVAARPRARRRTRASQGRAGQGADTRCPGHGREPHPLRVRQGAAEAALRLVKPREGAVLAGARRAGPRGASATTRRRRRRSPAAATPRSSRWTSSTGNLTHPALRRPARLRHPGEPHDRRGADPRRRRAGRRRRVLRDASSTTTPASRSPRRFMDFLMPTALEIPEIEIGHIETPSPLERARDQGRGEAGAIPVPALVAEAIDDALAPLGVRVREMPLDPDRLLRLIASARRA